MTDKSQMIKSQMMKSQIDKSILSFNISTADKTRLYNALISNQPFQIMPTRFKYINITSYTSLINKLKMLKEIRFDNVVIHTGYDIIVFKAEIVNSMYYLNHYINSYINFANMIHISNLLFHGPCNVEQFNNLDVGLMYLRTLSTNTKLNMIVEMPAFSKELVMYANTKFHMTMKQFVIEYLNRCVQFGLSLCIDTAHLYANGLNSDDIIQIIEMFQNYIKFIHLNGNCREQFKKDKHTVPILTTLTFESDVSKFEVPPDNMIDNFDTVLNYLSMKKFICILELHYKNYEYYSTLAKDYDFNIVDENVHSLIF